MTKEECEIETSKAIMEMRQNIAELVEKKTALEKRCFELEQENEELKRGNHYEAEVVNGRPTGKAILVQDRKREFELNLREDAEFILHEYKDEDGINYCLKDEIGNILLNIESSKMLGDRVVLMADSFRHKNFEVSVLKK